MARGSQSKNKASENQVSPETVWAIHHGKRNLPSSLSTPPTGVLGHSRCVSRLPIITVL
jgi:hypothetical protein